MSVEGAGENTLTDTRKRVSTRVDDFTIGKLEAEAKRRDMTVNAIVSEIVTERYGVKQKCIAEVFKENSYYCVWGRDKGNPKIKKLAEMLDEKNDVCAACQKTLELIKRVEQMEQELMEPFKIDIPICTGGAESREENGEIQFKCPDNLKWVRIEDFCMVKDRGQPCYGLKHNRVTVQKDKKKDMR